MSLADRPLSDLIYDDVRARILCGRLEPGAPVRQDALAAELGVSKIPLREALTRLERDGLLLAHPRRGWEVSPLSRDELEDVFDLRLKLEPAAAAEASARAGAEDHAAAQELLQRLDRTLAKSPDEASDLNRDFHLALVRPAARPLTLQLIERLHVLAERYVRAHLKPSGRSQRARGEHAALFDAWSRGDAPAVADLAESHIRATLEDLRAQLAA
jgi:DNA-binding GntR family transcriptional regulator